MTRRYRFIDQISANAVIVCGNHRRRYFLEESAAESKHGNKNGNEVMALFIKKQSRRARKKSESLSSLLFITDIECKQIAVVSDRHIPLHNRSGRSRRPHSSPRPRSRWRSRPGRRCCCSCRRRHRRSTGTSRSSSSSSVRSCCQRWSNRFLHAKEKRMKKGMKKGARGEEMHHLPIRVLKCFAILFAKVASAERAQTVILRNAVGISRD